MKNSIHRFLGLCCIIGCISTDLILDVAARLNIHKFGKHELIVNHPVPHPLLLAILFTGSRPT